jgi:hypothetical protein
MIKHFFQVDHSERPDQLLDSPELGGGQIDRQDCGGYRVRSKLTGCWGQ